MPLLRGGDPLEQRALMAVLEQAEKLHNKEMDAYYKNLEAAVRNGFAKSIK